MYYATQSMKKTFGNNMRVDLHRLQPKKLHAVNSLRKVDMSGLLLIQVLLQFDSRKRQLTLHVLVGSTVCISSYTCQYKGLLVENGE